MINKENMEKAECDDCGQWLIYDEFYVLDEANSICHTCAHIIIYHTLNSCEREELKTQLAVQVQRWRECETVAIRLGNTAGRLREALEEILVLIGPSEPDWFGGRARRDNKIEDICDRVLMVNR